MSRFGTTATILWDEGDTFTGANTISLEPQDMPQYPFEESREEDITEYRTISGEIYQYRNYNKRNVILNWTDLREVTRNEIYSMCQALPVFSFNSGDTDFGTFRLEPGSYTDSETAFELFDISFVAKEA